jgi:hypothetical protein
LKENDEPIFQVPPTFTCIAGEVTVVVVVLAVEPAPLEPYVLPLE